MWSRSLHRADGSGWGHLRTSASARWTMATARRQPALTGRCPSDSQARQRPPMAAFRLDLIARYLCPHRRTVMAGAAALVVVNILRVVSRWKFAVWWMNCNKAFLLGCAASGRLDCAGCQLDGDDSFAFASTAFGVGRQVEVDLRQRLFEHMLRQEPTRFRPPAAAK